MFPQSSEGEPGEMLGAGAARGLRFVDQLETSPGGDHHSTGLY